MDRCFEGFDRNTMPCINETILVKKKKKGKKRSDVMYNVKEPRRGVVKYRHCVPKFV